MRPYVPVAAFLLAVATGASAQAYKWIDKEGRVHYTQTPPPPDAKEVQRKTFRHGSMEASDLPYATRVASENFPVKLYTSQDCGPPCDLARALLVKRAVPFTEISVATQNQVDELKSLAGGGQVPTLLVGTQVQGGYLESSYNALLDSAGYPSSVAPLPIEALRKMQPAPKSPAADQSQEQKENPGTSEPEATER
jgi:glutaredoxin